ncbi:MAG: hypothetical protein HQ582_21865 [Planctomycetes bacterium]|nr:hypothetical protein [Planctomycetota bacterium]
MQRKRKKQLLIACVVIFAMLVGGTAWLASCTIAWARDLPNRFSIQIDDEFASAFGSAVIERLHAGLNDSNSTTQQETIRSLAECVAGDVSAIPWVRDDFSADLEKLSKSADADVADAASSLLTTLTPSADTVPPE